MDIDDPAAQHQIGAIAAQMTLCGMSDNPGQFRKAPMSALFRQAYRAASGHDVEMSYLTVRF
jgi:hypothetical protein